MLTHRPLARTRSRRTVRALPDAQDVETIARRPGPERRRRFCRHSPIAPQAPSVARTNAFGTIYAAGLPWKWPPTEQTA
jgi:hypothetical protein